MMVRSHRKAGAYERAASRAVVVAIQDRVSGGGAEMPSTRCQRLSVWRPFDARMLAGLPGSSCLFPFSFALARRADRCASHAYHLEMGRYNSRFSASIGFFCCSPVLLFVDRCPGKVPASMRTAPPSQDVHALHRRV